jgi:hypothetical protein
MKTPPQLDLGFLPIDDKDGSWRRPKVRLLIVQEILSITLDGHSRQFYRFLSVTKPT